MASIELLGVSHAYVPGEYAVRDIDLRWESGAACALLGPSGCGKTTLLKIISGLLAPTEGKVLLNGQDVTHLSPPERNIAQVFQFPVVYEVLSVFDNLAFPLRNRGVPEKRVRERVLEVADVLGLQDVLKRNASRLGAAQKQRVSVGRGIVREDTAAVLFDEPLTVIDPQAKWHLRRQLKEVHEQLGFTMVYVTHDQHEALTFADQVTVMDAGRAVQTGTPQELHEEPEVPFVGHFIGSPGMNLFGARMVDGWLRIGDGLPVRKLEAPEAAGEDELQVGIRPEFVRVGEGPVAGRVRFECRVGSVSLTGNAKILDLEGRGLSFKARVTEDTQVETGEVVQVVFPDDQIIVYVQGRKLEAKAGRAA